MEVVDVSLASIRPYPGNPRRNEAAIEKVAASIQEFGWRQPIVLDIDNVIVAGHTRFLAAQRLGLAQVPVHIAKGLTEAQLRAFRLADNRLHEDSSWDFERLAEELGALTATGYDLSLTGFNSEELAALLKAPADEGPDPDAAPPLPARARSVLGDIWICGAHRVGCADATVPAQVQMVTRGALADCIWTDPPYNVDYTGGTADALAIVNDRQSPADFLTFLRQAFSIMAGILKPGAAIYVAHAETEGTNFRRAFLDAGMKLSGVIVWRKNSLVMGRSDYQWQHEPILYGWKPGSSHRWYGGRKNTTIVDLGGGPFTRLADGRWQITIGDRVLIVTGDASMEELVPSVMQEDRPTRSAEHPTMKPIALIERMLKNSARTGDLVFDPFGGSGSTLIAADRLAMSAVLTELDPRYVDVIVKRWQEYTGRAATREKDGREFDQIGAKVVPITPEIAAKKATNGSTPASSKPAPPLIKTGNRRPVPIKKVGKPRK